MRYINKNIFLSFISFLIIIGSFFYLYLYLFKEKTKLIKFAPSGISINFEVDISNNIEDIENFLINYEFIKSYLIRLNDNDLNVEIILKEPFAKNNLNQEIYDAAEASESLNKIMTFIETNKNISWPISLQGGFQSSLTGRENIIFVCKLYFGNDQDTVNSKIRFVKN